MKALLSLAVPFLAVLALTVAGCAKSSYTVLKEYPSKSEDCPIEVLTMQPQDKKYEEVAILNAEGGQNVFSSRKSEKLIAQLKRDACEVGADAIIIRTTEDGRYAWGKGGWDTSKAMAIAIKWVEEKP
jgi:hypothetical protein